MTVVDDIAALLESAHLSFMGGFSATDDPTLPKGTQTVILLGPREPGFWDHLTAQPEWLDGKPDPVDRWSRRVIGRIACDLGAKALFPFGGPPWHPFYQWALRSGRTWDSPVRLLVHDQAGLMVSFRGAVALKDRIELPAPTLRPCDTCADKPCLTVCPPRALTGNGYDLPACHSFLDSADGVTCMTQGCAVRRACPVSRAYARMPEQSAYHMRQFHK
jgi:epoxyqueuosine reductase